MTLTDGLLTLGWVSKQSLSLGVVLLVAIREQASLAGSLRNRQIHAKRDGCRVCPSRRQIREANTASKRTAITLRTSLPITSTGSTTMCSRNPASMLATDAPQTSASRWGSRQPRLSDQEVARKKAAR